MIVREEPDGSLLLINQTDHAKISGLFAAHWGNPTFDRPRPYESVVRAAFFHDCGWYRYETSPRYDAAAGKTPTFTQVPLDPAQLGAFQWGIDWLTDIDPYAGLLISKHRTGLWRGRYQAIRHPPFVNARVSPAVEAFIAENEARQRGQEAAVDARELRVNYELLQFWDLLSLYFCVRGPYAEYVEPVPVRYADAQGVRVTLTPLDAGKVAIEPYPFDVPALAFDVPHRRLPTAKFPDEAGFRASYFQAPPRVLHYEVVKAA
jgi:hypothetical protein